MDAGTLLPVGMQLGIDAMPEDMHAARQLLIEKVNDLIVNDFEKLIFILYRMDVSEAKIARLLKAFPDQHAALIITGLMLEREQEKINSRAAFKKDTGDIEEDEKW